jgi:hypothetical protein
VKSPTVIHIMPLKHRDTGSMAGSLVARREDNPLTGQGFKLLALFSLFGDVARGVCEGGTDESVGGKSMASVRMIIAIE